MKTIVMELHNKGRELELITREVPYIEDIQNAFLKDLYELDENKLFIGVKNVKNNKEIKKWKEDIREYFIYNKCITPLNREDMKVELKRGIKIKYPEKLYVSVGWGLDTENLDNLELIKESLGKDKREIVSEDKLIRSQIKNNSIRLFNVNKQTKPYNELLVKDIAFLKNNATLTKLYLSNLVEVNNLDELTDLYLSNYKKWVKKIKFSK